MLLDASCLPPVHSQSLSASRTWQPYTVDEGPGLPNGGVAWGHELDKAASRNVLGTWMGGSMA